MCIRVAEPRGGRGGGGGRGRGGRGGSFGSGGIVLRSGSPGVHPICDVGLGLFPEEHPDEGLVVTGGKERVWVGD